MKKWILAVIFLILLFSIGYIIYYQISKPDKKFLENQVYCEKNADCVVQMSNCQLPEGILSCRNIYFKVPNPLTCAMVDIGLSPDDKCLCNTQVNKCEIIKS